MGCCMGGKRNSNNTGGTTVPNTDPSDDGTIPYWSSPGMATPGTKGVNGSGGPYAGQSSSDVGSYVPINTGGKCDGELGAMSAAHESGNNPGIVNADAAVGTDYGTYQLNSQRGAVSNFMKYLSVNDPDTYSRLSNSGSIDSSGFISAWKNEASTNPNFADLQGCFMKQTYYDKVVKNMKSRYGVDIDSYPLPVKQGIWSTAIQMGAGSSVFDTTFSNLPENASSQDVVNRLTDAKLTTDSNGRLSYFTKVSDSTQQSIITRFQKERNTMLNGL